MTAPYVTDWDFDFKHSPPTFDVMFSENVSASLAASDFRVDQVTTGDPDPVPASVSFNTTTNTATFSFAGILADGNYRAVIAREDVFNASNEIMAFDAVMDFSFLLCDIRTHATPPNHIGQDGYVDLSDFNGFAAHFGVPGPWGYDDGDFTYDGEVNLADFNKISARFGNQLPARVTGPNMISVSVISATNTLNLNWEDSTPTATGYRIQRSEDGQIFSIYEDVLPPYQYSSPPDSGEDSPAQITWTDAEVLDGTRYWYRVRAFGNGQDTAYTPKKAATTKLLAPDSVSAFAVSSSQVQSSWTDHSESETSFRINVFSAGVLIRVVEGVPANSTSWIVDQLQNGVKYTFEVQAVGAWNTSAVSLPSAPTQPWGMDLVFYETFFENVGDEWSPNRTADHPMIVGAKVLGMFENESATLTLGGLPPHTGLRFEWGMRASIHWVSGGDGMPAYFTVQPAGTTSTTIQLDGGTGAGPPPWALRPGSLDFAHSGATFAATFIGSGFETDYNEKWCLEFVVVTLLRPQLVLLPNVSTAWESITDYDKLKFTLRRDGTAWGDVSALLDPDGGTASPDEDYIIPNPLVLQGVQYTAVDVPLVDDAVIEAEWEQAWIKLVPSPWYALISTENREQGQIGDNDFEIRRLMINFNSARIKRDDGFQDLYLDNEWVDNNADNTDDLSSYESRYGGGGNLGAPLAYRRSGPNDNYIFAYVTFHVFGNPLGPVSVVGNGIAGPGAGNSEHGADVSAADPQAIRTVSSYYYCGPPTLGQTTPLPQTIQNDTLTIDWTVKAAKNVTKHYGASKNHIYVTGEGTGDGVFESVLDVACRNAVGLRPGEVLQPDFDARNQEVIDAVFGAFEGNSLTNVKDQALKYWSAGSPGTPVPSTTSSLLKNKDGRCGAWVLFLQDILTVHGIEAHVSEITPSGVAMDMLGEPDPPPGTSALASMEIKPQLSAQNNPAPWNLFANHAVLKISGSTSTAYARTIYDPSYGRSYTGSDLTAAEQMWQDTALNGWKWVYLTSGGAIDSQGQLVQHVQGQDEADFS